MSKSKMEDFAKLLEQNNAKLKEELRIDKIIVQMNKSYENIKQLTNSHEQLTKSVKEDLASINGKLEEYLKGVTTVSTAVKILEAKVDDRAECTARLNRLVLNGVPCKENENLQSIFQALSSHLGYSSSVEAQPFRYKSGDPATRAIFIKFPSEYYKEQYLSKYFKAKELKRNCLPGFEGDNSRIYLRPDLSPIQYSISREAAKLKKEGIIYQVKIFSGINNIKLDKDGKFIPFYNIAALHKEIDKE